MAARKRLSTNPEQSQLAFRSIIPPERIEQRIYLLRGQKVMLSHHLAELYSVAPMRLNEAVKRNSIDFPPTSCSSCRSRNTTT
jgi:hypothetical protein